jgi:hypothetical protein
MAQRTTMLSGAAWTQRGGKTVSARVEVRQDGSRWDLTVRYSGGVFRFTGDAVGPARAPARRRRPQRQRSAPAPDAGAAGGGKAP